MFDEELKELRRELETGNMIMFAGAGVSRNAGMPSWATFLRDLLRSIPNAKDHLPLYEKQLEQFLTNKEYLRAADAVRVAAGEGFYNSVAEQLKGYKTDISKLRSIARIPVGKYVTTNWDTLIEAACLTFHEEGIDQFWNTDDGYERFGLTSRSSILHLHGFINDPQRIVIDTPSYEKYTSDPRYVNGVRLLFASHPFLFVGLSFDDPPLLQFIEYCKKYGQFYTSHKSHALLLNPEKELLSLLNDANIQPLAFSNPNDLWTFIDRLGFQDDEAHFIRKKHVTALPDLRMAKTKLATAYSAVQVRLKHDEAEVQTKLVSALVLQELSQDKPKSTDEINRNVSNALIMKQKKALSLVEESLALLREKRLAIEVKKGSWQATEAVKDTIAEQLERIVANFYSAFEMAHMRPLDFPKQRMRDFLIYAIDRKSSIIAGRTESMSVTIPELLDDFVEYGERIKIRHIAEAIRLGMKTLNEDDASCLTQLAYAAYAFQLGFYDPEEIHGQAIKDIKEYFLDSSVLLPILAGGTPDATFNLKIVVDLLKAGKQLWASTGILEEIQSHLDAAKREYAELKSNDDAFCSSLYINARADENVFQYSFALIRSEEKIRFSEYLRKYVKWDNRDTLIKQLREKSIRIFDFVDEKGEIARIKAELRNYLDANDRKITVPRLLDHDAELVALVQKKDRAAGILTYDGKLKRICGLSRYSDASPRMVNPIRVANVLEPGMMPGVECRAYLGHLLPTGRASLQEVVHTHYFSRLLSGEHKLREKDIAEILDRVMQALQDLATKRKDVDLNETRYSKDVAALTLDFIDPKFVQLVKELE